MVAREIDLEEKRVYAPTPMIHEPFFSLPVVAAPTVQDTVVPAHVVIPPVATMNDDEEPILQDPVEPIATHEGEQQQPQTKDVSNVEAPRRSQRVRKSAIPQRRLGGKCLHGTTESFCHGRKRTNVMPSKEIHLWIKTSFKTVVL